MGQSDCGCDPKQAYEVIPWSRTSTARTGMKEAANGGDLIRYCFLFLTDLLVPDDDDFLTPSYEQ
jgi:hypothetical protein